MHVLYLKRSNSNNLLSYQKIFKLEPAKDYNYKLIAIHSTLKIHSLAFQINKYCYTNFIRSKNDILIDSEYKVPCFEWKINEKGVDFNFLKINI